MKIKGNTILVTGGGSGISEALAHRLHDLGNRVIIAGRHLETLEKAAAGRPDIHVLCGNIDNEADIADFSQRLLSAFPQVNVLVNNAGIMRREDPGCRRDMGDAEAMVATNFLGPLRLTNALVEHLTGQPEAAIINVTSGLAFVPMPQASTYSATKAALHSWTVSMRQILKGKVEVIELAPPGVQTEITPGQSRRQGYMPLAAFADEVCALLQQQPTPPEILVESVRFLRFAEAEQRFDQTLGALMEFARQETPVD